MIIIHSELSVIRKYFKCIMDALRWDLLAVQCYNTQLTVQI